MDYIALGHIHSPQLIEAGDIPVVYPGTLEGKRFKKGETGQRNLYVVTLEKGMKTVINKLPWNTKTF